MDAFIPMLKNVIIFVCLAIPGYILVKCGSLKQEHSGVLSKLLMYVGLPFMILSGTLGVSLNEETIKYILISAVFAVVITFICLLLAKYLVVKNDTDKERGMMRFAEVFSNNGFLGLPIAAAVFGPTSLVFTAVVIFNIINNVMLYTIGVYLVSCDKRTINLKNVLLNPVLIAFIIGIILNLLGVVKLLPEVSAYSDHFKNVVTPLSMTILGMKMGAVKISAIFKSFKTYYVSAVKLVLFPVIATAIAFGVNSIYQIGNDMIISIFIAFSMPTAGLASAFADRYDGDTNGAVIYTLGTTIFSVATIPLLYLLLCALL